jgi:hypothetical protein
MCVCGEWIRHKVLAGSIFVLWAKARHQADTWDAECIINIPLAAQSAVQSISDDSQETCTDDADDQRWKNKEDWMRGARPLWRRRERADTDIGHDELKLTSDFLLSSQEIDLELRGKGSLAREFAQSRIRFSPFGIGGLSEAKLSVGQCSRRHLRTLGLFLERCDSIADPLQLLSHGGSLLLDLSVDIELGDAICDNRRLSRALRRKLDRDDA